MLNDSNQKLFKILDRMLFSYLPLMLIVVGIFILGIYAQDIYNFLYLGNETRSKLMMVFIAVGIIFFPASAVTILRERLDKIIHDEESETKEALDKKELSRKRACNLYIKTNKR